MIDQLQPVPTPTLLSICLGERWLGSVIISDGRDHPGWGQISGQNVKIELPCQLAEPCIIRHSPASHVKISELWPHYLDTPTHRQGQLQIKLLGPLFVPSLEQTLIITIFFSNITLYFSKTGFNIKAQGDYHQVNWLSPSKVIHRNGLHDNNHATEGKLMTTVSTLQYIYSFE